MKSCKVVKGGKSASAENLLEFISLDAKRDIKEKVEFYKIPLKNNANTMRYLIPKNQIIGINAGAGTGKSYFLVELALFLLHSKQCDFLYYIDLDRNYQALQARNQSEFIENNDNFKLITAKQLRQKAENELKNIYKDLADLAKPLNLSNGAIYAKKLDDKTLLNEPSQIDLNGADLIHAKELTTKAHALEKILNDFNYLEIFSYFISDFLNYKSIDFESKGLKNCVFMLDSLNGFIPKLTDNQEVIRAFQGIFSDLIAKGASIFYLNHTTKGKNADGTPNFSGANNLINNTDYFVMLEKPFKERLLFNIKPLKVRIQASQNYAIEIDTERPLNERLLYTDYIPIDEGATDKQVNSRSVIINALIDGAKRFSELEKALSGKGLTKNDLNANLKALLDNNTITKTQHGAITLYSLKAQKEPTAIAWSEDIQGA